MIYNMDFLISAMGYFAADFVAFSGTEKSRGSE